MRPHRTRLRRSVLIGSNTSNTTTTTTTITTTSRSGREGNNFGPGSSTANAFVPGGFSSLRGAAIIANTPSKFPINRRPSVEYFTPYKRPIGELPPASPAPTKSTSNAAAAAASTVDAKHVARSNSNASKAEKARPAPIVKPAVPVFSASKEGEVTPTSASSQLSGRSLSGSGSLSAAVSPANSEPSTPILASASGRHSRSSSSHEIEGYPGSRRPSIGEGDVLITPTAAANNTTSTAASAAGTASAPSTTNNTSSTTTTTTTTTIIKKVGSTTNTTTKSDIERLGEWANRNPCFSVLLIALLIMLLWLALTRGLAGRTGPPRIDVKPGTEIDLNPLYDHMTKLDEKLNAADTVNAEQRQQFQTEINSLKNEVEKIKTEYATKQWVREEIAAKLVTFEEMITRKYERYVTDEAIKLIKIHAPAVVPTGTGSGSGSGTGTGGSLSEAQIASVKAQVKSEVMSDVRTAVDDTIGKALKHAQVVGKPEVEAVIKDALTAYVRGDDLAKSSDGLEKRITDLRKDLISKIDTGAESTNAEVAALKKARTGIDDRVKELSSELKSVSGRIKQLEDSDAKDTEAIAAVREQLTQLTTKVSAVESVSTHANEIETRLKALEDGGGVVVAGAGKGCCPELTADVVALSKRVDGLATTNTGSNGGLSADQLGDKTALMNLIQTDVESIVHRYVVGDKTARFDWANKINGARIQDASATYNVRFGFGVVY